MAKKASLLKFMIVLERFCGTIERVVAGRYRHAWQLVGLMLRFATVGDSRLEKMRRLKNKVRAETTNGDPRNSVSQLVDDRIAKGLLRSNVGGLRNKSVGKSKGRLPFDKENESSGKTMDAENRELVRRIRQTERFITAFMSDVEKKIVGDASLTFLEPSTSKEG